MVKGERHDKEPNISIWHLPLKKDWISRCHHFFSTWTNLGSLPGCFDTYQWKKSASPGSISTWTNGSILAAWLTLSMSAPVCPPTNVCSIRPSLWEPFSTYDISRMWENKKRIDISEVIIGCFFVIGHSVLLPDYLKCKLHYLKIENCFSLWVKESSLHLSETLDNFTIKNKTR